MKRTKVWFGKRGRISNTKHKKTWFWELKECLVWKPTMPEQTKGGLR